MGEQSNNYSLGTVLFAGLLGGLAGAVAGLMLAPKSGAELREDLKDKAQVSLHSLEQTAEQGQYSLHEVSSTLVDKGNQLAEDIRVWVHEIAKTKTNLFSSDKPKTTNTALAPQPDTKQ